MPSLTTLATFSPTLGWYGGPERSAPPGSTVSSRNWVVQDGRLELRPYFEWFGQSVGNPGALNAVPVGTSEYATSHGTILPVVFSASTVMYYNSAWTRLLGGGPGAPTAPHRVRGATLYCPRTDTNAFVFGSHATGPAIWFGPDSTRTASNLTNAPWGPVDMVAVNNRVVLWNVRASSSGTRFEQRLAWCAFNDPEDWTGPGSGTYDLTEAFGAGTRAFAWGNELVLATDKEIWRGTPGRGDRAWDFTPITRERGMPLPSHAGWTPYGIFWVDGDHLVWRYAGGQPEPVGQAIQRELDRTQTVSLSQHGDVGYSKLHRQVWLVHDPAGLGNAYAYAFVFHPQDNVWTRQVLYNGAASATPPMLFRPGTTAADPESLGVVSSEGSVFALTDNGGFGDRTNTTADAVVEFPNVFGDDRTTHRQLNAVQFMVQNTLGTASRSVWTVTTFSDQSSGGAQHQRQSVFTLDGTPSGESLVRLPIAPLTGRTFSLRIAVSGTTTSGASTFPGIALSEIGLAGRYNGGAGL